MDKVNLNGQMVIVIRAHLFKVKWRDSVLWYILTVTDMKVNGSKICVTAKSLNFSKNLQELSLKANG